MNTFGSYLKVQREKLNLTQTEFGALVGINSSAISRIENGAQKFTSSKLELLAKVFKSEKQKITDLFYADKFAYEAMSNDCSENVFEVAERTIKYLRQKAV